VHEVVGKGERSPGEPLDADISSIAPSDYWAIHREAPAFAEFALVRIGRLSVLPVPEPLWQRLLRMAGEK